MYRQVSEVPISARKEAFSQREMHFRKEFRSGPRPVEGQPVAAVRAAGGNGPGGTSRLGRPRFKRDDHGAPLVKAARDARDEGSGYRHRSRHDYEAQRYKREGADISISRARTRPVCPFSFNVSISCSVTILSSTERFLRKINALDKSILMSPCDSLDNNVRNANIITSVFHNSKINCNFQMVSLCGP